MTLPQLKTKFNRLVRELNNNKKIDMGFSTIVASGYEALVLAQVMKEYRRVYGRVSKVDAPAQGIFLNQKGGQFRTERAFRVSFQSGAVFFFATDIELFGLKSKIEKRPCGLKFEADVVVISEKHIDEVLDLFGGYPGPQHLDAVYECKSGKYDKGQLRELLGLRRHLSMLRENFMSLRPVDAKRLHHFTCLNASPAIPIKMVRPKLEKFFDEETANLYDLQQLAIK